MSIAIAQVIIVVLYVALVYFHSRSMARSNAKDEKDGVPMSASQGRIEVGMLLVLTLAALFSLHMGWKSVLIIPIGYCLWRASYQLEHGQAMGYPVDLSDVSAEIMFFLVCLLGLL